jgi:hypothetical protein
MPPMFRGGSAEVAFARGGLTLLLRDGHRLAVGFAPHLGPARGCLRGARLMEGASPALGGGLGEPKYTLPGVLRERSHRPIGAAAVIDGSGQALMAALSGCPGWQRRASATSQAQVRYVTRRCQGWSVRVRALPAGARRRRGNGKGTAPPLPGPGLAKSWRGSAGPGIG